MYEIISDQPSSFGQSYRQIRFDSWKDYEEWKSDPNNKDWEITLESMENFPFIDISIEKDIK